MANQMPTQRQVVRADAASRAQRAWAARVAGATWEQTAQLVGYSAGPVACRAVQRYFGKLPELDREAQRGLWRDRLEHLWRASVRDVSEQRPGAVRSGVAVAQRAAALDGLDAPTRVSVMPDALEFERVIRALSASTGPIVVEEGDIFEEGPDGVFQEVTDGQQASELLRGEGTAPDAALAPQA